MAGEAENVGKYCMDAALSSCRLATYDGYTAGGEEDLDTGAGADPDTSLDSDSAPASDPALSPASDPLGDASRDARLSDKPSTWLADVETIEDCCCCVTLSAGAS